MVSILLCTINRYDLTVQCIGSALAQAGTPFELLHVDNGSTDPRVVEYISGCNPAYQRLNKTNEGYAPMLNQMLLWAKGEHICVIDNDILLPENWLAMLVNANERIPQSGVSSYHCVMDLPPATVINDIEVHVRASSVFGIKFYSRRVIEKIGYYCEEYTPYGNEDVDFNHRAAMAGFMHYYMGGGHRAMHLGDDVMEKSPYRQMKWDSLAKAAIVLERRLAMYNTTGDYYVKAPELR